MHFESYDKYLNSDTWRAKRLERLALDRHRCRGCGSRDKLHVHHLTYDRFGGQERMADLVTVCEACHAVIHNIHRVNKGMKLSTATKKVVKLSSEARKPRREKKKAPSPRKQKSDLPLLLKTFPRPPKGAPQEEFAEWRKRIRENQGLPPLQKLPWEFPP